MNKKMIVHHFCSLFIQALAFAIAAQPLQLAVNQTLSLVHSQEVPGSLSLFNQSISSLNASLGTIEIECDATRFGVNPQLGDCVNANRYFAPTDTDRAWAQRHTGGLGDHYPLPFRMMGSKLICPAPRFFPVNTIQR